MSSVKRWYFLGRKAVLLAAAEVTVALVHMAAEHDLVVLGVDGVKPGGNFLLPYSGVVESIHGFVE